MEKLDEIDQDNITEEEFLNQAVAKIGPIQKTKNKTLTKDSFIKIFKYTGDYAKLKSKELKKNAQVERCEAFKKNPKKYLEALKKTV